MDLRRAATSAVLAQDRDAVYPALRGVSAQRVLADPARWQHEVDVGTWRPAGELAAVGPREPEAHNVFGLKPDIADEHLEGAPRVEQAGGEGLGRQRGHCWCHHWSTSPKP